MCGLQVTFKRTNLVPAGNDGSKRLIIYFHRNNDSSLNPEVKLCRCKQDTMFNQNTIEADINAVKCNISKQLLRHLIGKYLRVIFMPSHI